MTNYEKYRDEIIKCDGDGFCISFIRPKILKPMGKECSNIGCGYCHMLMSMWFMDEYKEHEEPEVDWSKIPIDTKIYVRENVYDKWVERHFAKYENGKIYAWCAGYTSWSAGGEDNVMPWKYAKLAEEENL